MLVGCDGVQYAAFEDEVGIYLVTEYASRGDVFGELDRRGGSMTEADAVRQVRPGAGQAQMTCFLMDVQVLVSSALPCHNTHMLALLFVNDCGQWCSFSLIPVLW